MTVKKTITFSLSLHGERNVTKSQSSMQNVEGTNGVMLTEMTES